MTASLKAISPFGRGQMQSKCRSASARQWGARGPGSEDCSVCCRTGLFSAAWIKPESDKGDNTADDDPVHVVVYEPGDKGRDSAAQGQRQANPFHSGCVETDDRQKTRKATKRPCRIAIRTQLV